MTQAFTPEGARRALATRATITVEAIPAAQAIVLFDDLSESLPETLPPSSDAPPDAMMNAPSPVRSAPSLPARTTMNGVESAVTSISERTTRNFCRSRSLLTSAHISFMLWPSLDSGSASGSSMPLKTSDASAHIKAPTASSAAIVHCGRLFGKNVSSRPIASVNAPARAVARPVILPRRPLEIVRPCTSLPASEHNERNNAWAARRIRMTAPSGVPSRSNALSAMSPAAMAWPHEPMSHTRLRERFEVTHGLKNACGSIEPDSRMGTRNEVITAGTPAAPKSHGSTVFGATIWSPMFCRPLDQTNRRALRSSR